MFFYSEQDQQIQPVMPNIVTDSLHMYVDASLSTSYIQGQNTWTDLSGNGRNGTIVGGVTYSSDAGGTLSFDGSTGYVDFGDGPFQFAYPYFSFGLWFHWDNVAKGADLISDRSPDYPYSNKTLAITVSSNGGVGKNLLTFLRPDGVFDYYNPAVPLPTQVGYYQAFVTVEGNIQKTYLNGAVIATGNASFSGKSFRTSGYPMTVGAANITSGKGGFFNDKIGSVFYYSKALSQEEITQNFNATKSRFGL